MTTTTTVCGYSAAHTASGVPADVQVAMGPLGPVPCCTPCADTYDRLTGQQNDRQPLAAVGFAVSATYATTSDEDGSDVFALEGPLAFGADLEGALVQLPGGDQTGEVYAVWVGADVENRAGGYAPDSRVVVNAYGDAMVLADSYLSTVMI